jgi:hypothetical protein
MAVGAHKLKVAVIRGPVLEPSGPGVLAILRTALSSSVNMMDVQHPHVTIATPGTLAAK